MKLDRFLMDSSFGMVMGYGMEGWGSILGECEGCVSSLQPPGRFRSPPSIIAKEN
jgi:hypothetical protein